MPEPGELEQEGDDLLANEGYEPNKDTAFNIPPLNPETERLELERREKEYQELLGVRQRTPEQQERFAVLDDELGKGNYKKKKKK